MNFSGISGALRTFIKRLHSLPAREQKNVNQIDNIFTISQFETELYMFVFEARRKVLDASMDLGAV